MPAVVVVVVLLVLVVVVGGTAVVDVDVDVDVVVLVLVDVVVVVDLRRWTRLLGVLKGEYGSVGGARSGEPSDDTRGREADRQARR